MTANGNWDVFAGQMFPELSRERHVVEPFALPPAWRRYCSVDWGFAAFWGVLWAAVDEDGRVWWYREAYAQQVGEADQARRILAAEAEGERIAVRFGDDAMFATRGDAKPISTVYRENGCHLTPANKGARVPGWQRLRTYLAEAPACPHHRALGWETCPMMHIFSTLKEFYRTLSDIPHATKGDPEDADSDGEDHLPDCARYLLINLGGGAEQWIRWARAKAIQAGASVDGLPPARPEPQAELTQAPAGPESELAQEPELVGVVLSPAEARKKARDELYRATPDAIALRFMNGS